MKSLFFKHLLASAVVAVVAVGCASSGYKKADKVGSGISGFRDEIVSIKGAVEATMDSLDAIVTQASGDPRKAYDQYVKNLKGVDSAVAKARKRADDMQKAGSAYFEKWQADLQQVNNQEIRKLAEERKEELNKTFAQIKEVMTKAKADFDPWLADVKDLEKLFTNDLTVAGINAARSLVAKTRKEGSAVTESLDEVIAELNKISATLTASRVQQGS